MIHFLVTIDTEEEREWGAEYNDHSQYTVRNIQFLEPLQKLFDRHGVKATYLIDYPVAADQKAMQILSDFRKNRQAEIGLHLHPWVNPPYEEERTLANTFPANLPPELQLKKLKILSDLISQTLGEQPLSYRAGRYGFNESSVPVLEELGVLVDSSVVPFRKGKQPFEPSFGYLASIEPYRLNRGNIKEKGDSSVLEVPVTVGFNKKLPQWLAKNYIDLPNIGLRRLLKKFWGLDLYWLRPSYANLNQMIELSEHLIRSGVSFLNMMFHSNELMPGGSKYCKTQDDVDRYLKRLDDYFTYLNANHSVRYVQLREMYQIYSG
ncbi:hypothetical protein Calab_2316 [Caldithrix abyssi DSM 13497]|uniref:WalW protein n=1 Tax=Caldithrix abyssi DSM 13497 TaxID=880073 RepID=H1XXE1_CALAY|nr:hypothetical protein [Caldithrix abyssi]APF17859.1 hypothetical protein Cabys_1110 [Caldithrix abyssi DSM 13497]EHO41926.1 hypothetical protein Calab_2316 [Caldithrix abyssi DSM 13497]